MSNSEPDIELYRLYKGEVAREDDIIYQRNVSSLTFQGFLFASVTFLISNPWFPEIAVPIYPFRKFILVLQGATGIFVALLTAAGVMAAASSIKAVSMAYQHIPRNPLWPQLHGQTAEFRLGGSFAIAIHFVLAALWAVYLIALAISLYQLPCIVIAIVSVLLVVLIAGTFYGARCYLASKEPARASPAD